MIQQTLVLIKPDAVARQIVGQVLTRFEQAGLKIVGLKMVKVDRDFAKKHYLEEDIAKRRGYDVWNYNLDFISKAPIVAITLEGVSAVAVVRKMVGSTDPHVSAPGTIRGDFSHHSIDYVIASKKVLQNIVHASASVEEAKREVAVWFSDTELHAYKTVHEGHTY